MSLRPQAGFLTLASGTSGSLTFNTAILGCWVSASADCTLTYAPGQTTTPGAVPSSATVVSSRGIVRLIANKREWLPFTEGGIPPTITTCAFLQSSGASVDLTVEGF